MPRFTRISSAVSLVAPLVLNSVALALDRWFLVADGNELQMLGLRRNCVYDVCGPIDYSSTFRLDDCERTGDSLRVRHRAVHGLLVAATAMCAVAGSLFAASGAAARAPSLVATLGVIACAAALVLHAVSGALHYYVVVEWAFCGRSYCDFIGSDDCEVSIGTSYALWGTAAAALLPATLGAAVANRKDAALDARKRKRSHTQIGGTTLLSPPDIADAQEAGEMVPSHPAGVPEGFELDAETGYYYSSSAAVYLDTASGHFFYPDRGEWLDPNRDEWYTCE